MSPTNLTLSLYSFFVLQRSMDGISSLGMFGTQLPRKAQKMLNQYQNLEWLNRRDGQLSKKKSLIWKKLYACQGINVGKSDLLDKNLIRLILIPLMT